MWAGQLHALMLCIQQLQLQTDSGFIHLLLCIQATVYAAMLCRRRHVARPEQTELHVLSLKQQLLSRVELGAGQTSSSGSMSGPSRIAAPPGSTAASADSLRCECRMLPHESRPSAASAHCWDVSMDRSSEHTLTAKVLIDQSTGSFTMPCYGDPSSPHDQTWPGSWSKVGHSHRYSCHLMMCVCRARLDSHYRHTGSAAKGNPFAEAEVGIRRSADASLPSAPEESYSYRERLARYRRPE